MTTGLDTLLANRRILRADGSSLLDPKPNLVVLGAANVYTDDSLDANVIDLAGVAATPVTETLADSSDSTISYTLAEGYDYLISVYASADNGSGGLAFVGYRTIGAYRATGGAAVEMFNLTGPSNFPAGWALAVTVTGNDVQATLSNSSGSPQDVRLELLVEKATALP